MEAMFARYFDGDLDEGQAQQFLDAVESDPRLEKELRAYEHMLAVGKALPGPLVPSGFTARVMAALPDATPARRGLSWFSFPQLRWAQAAAVAAVVVIAFVGGWWSRSRRVPARIADTPISTTELTSASPEQTQAAGNGLRYVRLVYVPTDPNVQQVTVAGSFNNWGADTTPMRQQGNAFSTIIVLPPGSYEYMFVEDGARWVTDPLALETRDDGFGGVNAVLDVEL